MATSDSLLRESPALSLDTAADIARDHFALDGVAAPLPSERDQNFLIVVGGRPRAVLKVASAAEDRAHPRSPAGGARASRTDGVDNTARAHGDERGGRNTRRDSRRRRAVASRLGREPFTRAASGAGALSLTSRCSRRSAVSSARSTRRFRASTIRRFIATSTGTSPTRARPSSTHRSMLMDAELGAAIDTLVDRFDRHTAPLLDALPRAVVHGDLERLQHSRRRRRGRGVARANRHGHRGLRRHGAQLPRRRPRDRDRVRHARRSRSARVAASARPRLSANEVRLDDNELAALFGLAALRLCASACIAADQLGEAARQ